MSRSIAKRIGAVSAPFSTKRVRRRRDWRIAYINGLWAEVMNRAPRRRRLDAGVEGKDGSAEPAVDVVDV
ncbi:MAG: hypothetical protein QOJ52_2706, partial [Acidimicrobiaceae bacterium]|nr:hypothetical protein [Acidimicrobiaceae bacterium]